MDRFDNIKRITAILRLAVANAIALPASCAQVSSAVDQKAPGAGEMLSIGKTTGHGRVIAQFSDPVPGPEIAPDTTALASIRAKVAVVQDATIKTHRGGATNPRSGAGLVRGIARFPITPGFAINATAARINALANDPRAIKVDIDQIGARQLMPSFADRPMPTAYLGGVTGVGWGGRTGAGIGTATE